MLHKGSQHGSVARRWQGLAGERSDSHFAGEPAQAPTMQALHNRQQFLPLLGGGFLLRRVHQTLLYQLAEKRPKTRKSKNRSPLAERVIDPPF